MNRKVAKPFPNLDADQLQLHASLIKQRQSTAYQQKLQQIFDFTMDISSPPVARHTTAWTHIHVGNIHHEPATALGARGESSHCNNIIISSRDNGACVI